MTDILIAELSLPAYAALSHQEAADLLNAPVDGTHGAFSLDSLDSLFIRLDLWPTVEAAAAGTLPEAASQQLPVVQAGAVHASRQIVETLRSVRQHPYIDTAQTEFLQGLQAMVACGVVAAEVAAYVLAGARLTRCQQLGIGSVVAADVSRARRIGGLS